MTDLRNIYRYLLPLPLILSLAAYLVSIFVDDYTDWLKIPAFIVMLSGLYGGIPYIIIATSILVWSRKKSEAQIRKALLLSPLGMVALFGVAFVIIVMTNIFNRMNITVFGSIYDYITGMGIFFLFLSGFSLVLGYAYVALFFGIVRLFRGYSFSKTLK